MLAGETGVLLVRQRLSPSSVTLERLRDLVAANVGDDHRELVWGSPGTMLVASELGFGDLWHASAESLLAARDPETGLWEQNLRGKSRPAPGRRPRFRRLRTGARRGSTARPRPPAATRWWRTAWRTGRRTTTARSSATGRSGPVVPRRPGNGHVARRHLLDEDLALAGGELTWRAGPLAKGASLCHGTAGNGYAFLTLFERTGDERWLDRARRFAVHSIAQVERARADHGMGRYSLWTGDLGTALYLADCIDGAGRLPLP